jgi:hypothetical protein
MILSLRALGICRLTMLNFQTSIDDPFLSILLFIESWLKKGFADEDLKCTSMIKELVLPLVSCEAISEKMEAEANEIVRLIEEPNYVRRSKIIYRCRCRRLTKIFRSASGSLKTVLRYRADLLTGPKV